ncbi:MAG: hypothetical protein NTX03_01660 [Bacteroidetes bacterium]|nr:hypothetical protein [Bacteroidota bacterium]
MNNYYLICVGGLHTRKLILLIKFGAVVCASQTTASLKGNPIPQFPLPLISTTNPVKQFV